ncbi:hypothetical protein ALP20_200046 [Pseudomonas coronafaciens pv. coronafaciens]|nr:hypothetical protein ALP20_200046 [Pseudomonas coronafaciens pv. coronafaciens]
MHPLDTFTRQGFTGSQTLLSFAPLSHITEKYRNLAVVRIAHLYGSHVEPTVECSGVILERFRLPGFCDVTVYLKPERLEVRRKLCHPLATQIDTGFPLEGRIGL